MSVSFLDLTLNISMEYKWPSRSTYFLTKFMLAFGAPLQGTSLYGTYFQRYADLSTVEPLWKGQESLTEVAKFGPFSCIVLYKSCLFYPSWQATSFERPPSWVAFIEGFHCIRIRTIFQCLAACPNCCAPRADYHFMETEAAYYWGFYKILSTHPSTRPDPTGLICLLSAMGWRYPLCA